LGDHFREATILRRMGTTYRSIGDELAAREAWHQAAVILRALDHPDLEVVRADLTILDGTAEVLVPVTADPGVRGPASAVTGQLH
jgi:hypothetical protein